MQRFAVFAIGEEMKAMCYKSDVSTDMMDDLVADAKGLSFGTQDLTGWAVVFAHSSEEAILDQNAAALLRMPAAETSGHVFSSDFAHCVRMHKHMDGWKKQAVLVPA